VVVGAGGVGKSACIIQFLENYCVEEYDPTIEECYRKQLVINGTTVKMDITDTAGLDEYSAMRDCYMRSGGIFIIMYAITSRFSFEDAAVFKEQICRVKDLSKVPIVLVGNKCDLEERREVMSVEGMALAKSWNCPFFESSAKTRVNVAETFHAAALEYGKFSQRLYRPGVMCGILALVEQPNPISNILNDVDSLIGDGKGCCHDIVEERFEGVWREMLPLLGAPVILRKGELKETICRRLGHWAMQQVTQKEEVDSLLAEALLLHRNAAS